MLFSKAFIEIKPTDIEELCRLQYPESDQVEYKQFVPGKTGPDRWHIDQSRGMSEYARDSLLAEIIAFANSHGGHLIVGIEESDDKPKRAVAPYTVPASADFADRLTQAAFACVEPRLADLQIRGVPTSEQGEGFVVVRVPESRNAPHRLTSNLECYIRRGESTERMTMREIQDLTLNKLRGTDWVDQQLEVSQKQFENRSHIYTRATQVAGAGKKIAQARLGLRCTVVPLLPFQATRPVVDQVLSTALYVFPFSFGTGHQDEMQTPYRPESNGPVLRGSVGRSKSREHSFEHFVRYDGVQDLFTIWVNDIEDEHGLRIYISWILGTVAAALHSATQLAKLHGSPAAEFAVQVQITSQVNPTRLFLSDQYGRSERLPEQILQLPLYSFVPDFGLVQLLNEVHTDIRNSVGHRPERPIISVG